MSEPIRKPNQIPESYVPKKPEILNLAEKFQNVEKTIKSIRNKGVEFEIVQRTDVLWVGCVDYASNNTDETDIHATLKRYREELIDIKKRDLINPDWSASLSINYRRDDRPCGLMFAQETYSRKQDKRYELLVQPGGLWLRIHITEETDAALLGRKNYGLYEYFAGDTAPLQSAARENGYKQNPDVDIQIEYGRHTGPSLSYAYIPIINA